MERIKNSSQWDSVSGGLSQSGNSWEISAPCNLVYIQSSSLKYFKFTIQLILVLGEISIKKIKPCEKMNVWKIDFGYNIFWEKIIWENVIRIQKHSELFGKMCSSRSMEMLILVSCSYFWIVLVLVFYFISVFKLFWFFVSVLVFGHFDFSILLLLLFGFWFLTDIYLP